MFMSVNVAAVVVAVVVVVNVVETLAAAVVGRENAFASPG
jgi:hypothetical protein